MYLNKLQLSKWHINIYSYIYIELHCIELLYVYTMLLCVYTELLYIVIYYLK